MKKCCFAAVLSDAPGVTDYVIEYPVRSWGWQGAVGCEWQHVGNEGAGLTF